MKKTISAILLLLSIQMSFAQDWLPFVKDQISYYKQEQDSQISIESFIMDSVKVVGDTEYYYFNSQSDLKGECNSNIKEQFNLFGYLNPHKIDSLQYRNDSLFYVSDYGGITKTFLFKPHCKVNDYWRTYGRSIRCIQAGTAEIFGVQDSIKTFGSSGSVDFYIEFILSKSHGFIKFIPFNEILFTDGITDTSTYFELVGFQKEDVSKGYRQPQFEDYFHLNPGDKLYWENYEQSWDMTPVIRTYSIDSILKAYHSDDTVRYEMRRTDYYDNYEVSHIDTIIRSYYRSEEGGILRNPTSWFGTFENSQYRDVFFFKSLDLTFENGDTTSFAEYQISGVTIDTFDCSVHLIMDYDLTERYSTREGLVFRASYSWGESSTTLIGSIIDGKSYGTIFTPTPIISCKKENLEIYPNPAIDKISIQNFDRSGKIILFNILGIKVMDLGFHPSQEIDISMLKKGIYTVVLDGAYSGRFVKM